MPLIVRPMRVGEVGQMVAYFHRLGHDALVNMGVDPPKLPEAAAWQKLLVEDFSRPIDQRQFFYTTWEVDGTAVGHCNVNKIDYEKNAFMHLHVWRPELRRQGLGTDAVSRSIELFFKTLRLQELFCEPYANNEPPNRTLPKVGFQHLKTYETVPGWINYLQMVSRWRLDRSQLNLAQPTRIETDRLVMREFCLQDCEAVFQLATDPAVSNYTRDPVSVRDLDDARRLIVDVFHHDYREHGYGRLAVVEKKSNQVIGFCGLKYLEDFGAVDIGYRLLPDRWGRGYATEAARAVLADGRKRLGLDNPLAFVVAENVASIRVLEKIGFEQDRSVTVETDDDVWCFRLG